MIPPKINALSRSTVIGLVLGALCGLLIDIFWYNNDAAVFGVLMGAGLGLFFGLMSRRNKWVNTAVATLISSAFGGLVMSSFSLQTKIGITVAIGGALGLVFGILWVWVVVKT
jgi:hypothetical protein